jgi:hypothetical protein
MNTTTTKKSEPVQVVKTAQKKVEPQEEMMVMNPFVDTFWNQYEQSLEQVRKQRETREDVYLKSVKEVIKFNQEFRKSVVSLYEETKKTSGEIVKGVSGNFFKKEAEMEVEQPELTKQMKEVTDRLEKLAVTPIKSTFEIVGRIEKSLEESSENYVRYARESRKGWQKVTNEYVKMAKNNHNLFVNRLEESVKVLVSTK